MIVSFLTLLKYLIKYAETTRPRTDETVFVWVPFFSDIKVCVCHETEFIIFSWKSHKKPKIKCICYLNTSVVVLLYKDLNLSSQILWTRQYGSSLIVWKLKLRELSKLLKCSLQMQNWEWNILMSGEFSHKQVQLLRCSSKHRYNLFKRKKHTQEKPLHRYLHKVRIK